MSHCCRVNGSEFQARAISFKLTNACVNYVDIKVTPFFFYDFQIYNHARARVYVYVCTSMYKRVYFICSNNLILVLILVLDYLVTTFVSMLSKMWKFCAIYHARHLKINLNVIVISELNDQNSYGTICVTQNWAYKSTFS